MQHRVQVATLRNPARCGPMGLRRASAGQCQRPVSGAEVQQSSCSHGQLMDTPTSDKRTHHGGHSWAAPSRPSIGLPELTREAKGGIRILVVDDDYTLRDSCASVLEYEGYKVSLCSRGGEARETLKRNRFDIVLLDLYMTEVPGMRLLRTCLEAQPDT